MRSAKKTLRDEDVAKIMGMLRRGDRQSDIATLFGLNQARVNELNRMSTAWARSYRHVQPSDSVDLPEPGPYVVVGRGGYERLKAAAAIPDELLQRLFEDIAEIKERLRGIT